MKSPDSATSTGTVYKIVPSYPLQMIESSDASGSVRNTFDISESVYVLGSGFPASSTFDIYIVEDVVSWTAMNGMPIPASASTDVPSITSNSSGQINVALLWSHPTLGNYDIIVDVNRNGLYDAGIDPIDSDDVVTAGVIIVPELSPVLAFCLFGTVTAVAAFKHGRKREAS